MNVARRRSGAYRSIAACSPKARVARPTSLRQALPSNLQAPLSSKLTTGRHTTIGHSGCASASRPLSTRATTSTSTLRSARESVSSITSQRSLASTNRTISGVPISTRSVSRSLPGAAPRPPSELSLCKEKIAQLEKDLSSKEESLKIIRELSEMQKTSLETTKMKLETVSMERDSFKVMVNELKDQQSDLKTKIQQDEDRMKNLSEQLDEKDEKLRSLHNDVVDLRGQIRVAVRVRPLLKSEEESSHDKLIEYPTVNAISINQGPKSSGTFTFEKVFTPVFSQKSVFENIEDFILSALHGYNVGLIAFGQTGSGKTHTMRGGEGDQEGIIPRAASFLFVQSKKLEVTGWKFEFSLSFLEIYNDGAYDLLNNHAPVKIRIANQTVSIDGLTEHPLTKQSEMGGLLLRADKNRKTAATKCNEYSSRSHAIYMWKIKAHQESTGISTSSVLKLVDLAGSERAKESGVSGQQFKEMTAINQSLSVLQKCVNLQKAKSAHVPYRDSKLTQVLMDCLGRGSSKTMVVVNINPCNKQATESKRSIEFASKMRETHIGSAEQQRDL